MREASDGPTPRMACNPPAVGAPARSRYSTRRGANTPPTPRTRANAVVSADHQHAGRSSRARSDGGANQSGSPPGMQAPARRIGPSGATQTPMSGRVPPTKAGRSTLGGPTNAAAARSAAEAMARNRAEGARSRREPGERSCRAGGAARGSRGGRMSSRARRLPRHRPQHAAVASNAPGTTRYSSRPRARSSSSISASKPNICTASATRSRLVCRLATASLRSE